jgi:hypothetical protein
VGHSALRSGVGSIARNISNQTKLSTAGIPRLRRNLTSRNHSFGCPIFGAVLSRLRWESFERSSNPVSTLRDVPDQAIARKTSLPSAI